MANFKFILPLLLIVCCWTAEAHAQSSNEPHLTRTLQHFHALLDSSAQYMTLAALRNRYRPVHIRDSAPDFRPDTTSGRVSVVDVLQRALSRARLYPTLGAITLLYEQNPELFYYGDMVPAHLRLPLPSFSRAPRLLRKSVKKLVRYYNRPDTAENSLYRHNVKLYRSIIASGVHNYSYKYVLGTFTDTLLEVEQMVTDGDSTIDQINKAVVAVLNNYLLGLNRVLSIRRDGYPMDTLRFLAIQIGSHFLATDPSATIQPANRRGLHIHSASVFVTSETELPMAQLVYSPENGSEVAINIAVCRGKYEQTQAYIVHYDDGSGSGEQKCDGFASTAIGHFGPQCYRFRLSSNDHPNANVSFDDDDKMIDVRNSGKLDVGFWDWVGEKIGLEQAKSSRRLVLSLR